jgi:hypothetical protein
MDAIWNSGAFVGAQRPMVRITVGAWTMKETAVPGNVYRSAIFGQTQEPIELPNVQQWTWTKSTGQAAGTFQLNLINVKAYPPGVAAQLLSLGRLETGMQQGAYTPNYTPLSASKPSTNVGYNKVLPPRARNTASPWQSLLIPDTIIKSYEGFGVDPSVAPEADANLVQTGIWLIDQVVYGTDGTIVVTGRDLGRLFVDTITVFPNVPANWYPLSFDAFQNVPAITALQPVTQSASGTLTPDHSSNLVHNGDAPEYGHRLADAFDSDRSTYWLSVGNAAPNADYSFEYVEGDMPAGEVSAVTVDVVKGPYTAYISVYADGAWQGANVVPYNPDDPISGPNGSNIPYVTAGSTNADAPTTFTFSPIKGATKIRCCLTNLQDFGLGPYVHRAGIRTLSAKYSQVIGEKKITLSPAKRLGNYADFTDLIKLFSLWSGFYWPRTDASFVNSDGTTQTQNAPSNDSALKEGRVWGDLAQTGTVGLVSLTADIWDHITMADAVAYIQDMIGFVFFIGDLGGVVWRLPNYYTTGNYYELDEDRVGGAAPRTHDTVLIDETKQLQSLFVTLNSQNVRERVAVSTANGSYGAVVAGFNPNPDGQIRIGVYSDYRFASAKECRIMAELVALQQMFTFRTDQVIIPGYPRLQIDDQVLIKEQITGEYYRHYISGIVSAIDLGTGVYNYTLTTNWLGNQPIDYWAFDFTLLSQDTQEYLKTLGQAPAYAENGST